MNKIVRVLSLLLVAARCIWSHHIYSHSNCNHLGICDQHYEPRPPPVPQYPAIICQFKSSDDQCNYGMQYHSEDHLIPFQWTEAIDNLSGDGFMTWKWIVDSDKKCVFGGRLVSRSYPSHGLRQACFKIRYLMWGSGISDIRIFQRDHYRTKCIFFARNENREPTDKWITERIIVDITHCELFTFFIEAMANRDPGEGYLAIDSIELNYHKC